MATNIKLKCAKALVVCAVSFSSIEAFALELGIEAMTSIEASDNVYGANAGSETQGQLGFGQIGIYGEQRGRMVQGAFSGELETRKVLSDDDDDFDALTRFVGAVNVGITPETISWYFGDILGGVRTDNAIQNIDDSDLVRRNVFVTGPTVQFNLGAFSRVESRLLFVHQSDEDGELASLYNFNTQWQTETQRGSTWGIRFGDIYTDHPSSPSEPGFNETDFNRVSGSVFWEQTRGRNSFYAGLGATRYDTETDSVTGLNAALTYARQLSPERTLSLSLNRDLQDQTLSTVESLITDGSGEEPEANGFFDETRLQLAYDVQTSRSSFEAGVGVAVSDYQLLADINENDFISDNSEDQTQPFAYATLSRRVNARLTTELGLNYEQLEYDNRNDESSSILLSAAMFYKLGRSVSVELGYIHDQAEGLRTRFTNGVGEEEEIDTTENRVRLGLRWAPPSRASKALTVDLKSLLQ